MICLKCGFENPDGVNFCSCCGAEITNQPIDEKQLCDEQPEEMMGTVLPEEENAFQLNLEGMKPEKKRTPLAIIFALVGVVLAAALVFMLVPACRAFFVRTFRSPDKLLYTVYRDAAEGAIDNMDDIAFEQNDGAVKTDTHLLLGDQIISLAASSLYSQPEDLQALSDIGISCVSSSQNDLKKMLFTLSLSGTEIIDAEYYEDRNNLKHYVVIPELQEQAILIDTGDAFDAEDQKMLEEFYQYDVDEELLRTLTLRYMQIYFDGFESVEKSNKTLQLQGVSQKVTALEACMTEKALYQVMVNIFEAMKTDPEVKQFVESLVPFMGDSSYEDFIEMLDELITDLNSKLADGSFEYEFIVKTYINSRNDIVGAGLTYIEQEETKEAFSYITVRDGRQLAHKIVIAEDWVVEGSGIYDEGYTANFNSWYQGKEVLEVKVDGFVKNEQGFAGKLTFIPTKDTVSGILNEMGMSDMLAQAANLMDVSVEVILDSKETGSTTKVSLMAGSSMLLGVTYSSEPCQSEAITLPESYVSIDDEEAGSAWAEGIRMEGVEKIMERLEEAGLSELLTAFASLMMQ